MWVAREWRVDGAWVAGGWRADGRGRRVGGAWAAHGWRTGPTRRLPLHENRLPCSVVQGHLAARRAPACHWRSPRTRLRSRIFCAARCHACSAPASSPAAAAAHLVRLKGEGAHNTCHRMAVRAGGSRRRAVVVAIIFGEGVARRAAEGRAASDGRGPRDAERRECGVACGLPRAAGDDLGLFRTQRTESQLNSAFQRWMLFSEFSVVCGYYSNAISAARSMKRLRLDVLTRVGGCQMTRRSRRRPTAVKRAPPPLSPRSTGTRRAGPLCTRRAMRATPRRRRRFSLRARTCTTSRRPTGRHRSTRRASGGSSKRPSRWCAKPKAFELAHDDFGIFYFSVVSI